MNTRCEFNASQMSFVGTALEQARCLLRFVKRQGNVNDTPATLPATLTSLLQAPDTLGFTKTALRAALTQRGVAEANIGGSLDDRVSRANNDDESASPANYFVIHDTSTKLPASQSFDPEVINTSEWSGNNLGNQPAGVTHVYISRDGKTKTDGNYHTPRRATQFELKHVGSTSNTVIHKGRFLHHELVQPRKGPGNTDPDSPDPGFTPVQYELLAFCYLAASLRRGRWLIPAFHCVLDLGVGDHDDPQRFELDKWDAALTMVLSMVRTGTNPQPARTLESPILRDDPALQRVARGELTLAATGGQVQGAGPVQDGLNLLSARNPDFGIELGGNRGAFGPRTEKAVKAFQTEQGLPVTGKVDAVTLLALDRALVEFAASHGEEGEDFSTPAGSAETLDGSGGSTTTGLHGRITTPSAGVELTDATETLTAKRDNHSLGGAKVVRQTRRKENGVTVVTQADYCWGNRELPDAVLTDSATGLSDDSGVFSGKATFFGKGDNRDEGTGTPLFGTVQSNSSVFGISLPKARLLSEGLVVQNANGTLSVTEKGRSARVEVFFPTTGRRVLLPVIDVGPAPQTHAAADLTVAATAFLQKKTEEQRSQFENIQVKMRVV